MESGRTILMQALPIGPTTAERQEDDRPRRRPPLRPPPVRPGLFPEPEDDVTLLGLPLGQVPLPVQQRFEALAAEVERLRRDLDTARLQIGQLEDAAEHHPLFPALHRRSFLKALGRLIVGAERAGMPGTVICLHIGGIDQMRQVHGLAAAEAALTHMSLALRESLRRTDLLGYLDGGDFAVALALSEGEGAEDKARQLVQSLSEEEVLWRGRKFRFTILQGQSHFPPYDSPEELLLAADANRRGGGTGGKI